MNICNSAISRNESSSLISKYLSKPLCENRKKIITKLSVALLTELAGAGAGGGATGSGCGGGGCTGAIGC